MPTNATARWPMGSTANPIPTPTGPGRAANGNFTLTEFSVSAGGQPVRIAQARADFSQTSFGGWAVEAALDGRPQIGWGIDHADRQHSIGRLRLSATSAKPPIPAPPSETQFVVGGTLPPAKTGGTLAVPPCHAPQPTADRRWPARPSLAARSETRAESRVASGAAPVRPSAAPAERPPGVDA